MRSTLITLRGDRRRREAFTLIELLVAMTVGILLIVILFQIFGVAATAWQRSENQVDAYREARAALQLMTRDLSAISFQFPTGPASLPTDGGIAPNLVLDKYPSPDPARQAGDLNNEEVYCLTTVPNTGLSSLCAVGYFCQWLPDVARNGAKAPRAYALYRQFLGSGSTTQPGLCDLLTKSATKPLGFMDLFGRSSPAATATPDLNNVTAAPVELSAYIWDLQLRIDTNLQDARGSAQPPKDHGDLATPPRPRKYTSLAGEQHPLQLPPYVEIRFKALSAAGARQLEGNPSVTRSTWWPANPTAYEPIYRTVILPSTQQFVARVPLQCAGIVP